MQMCQYLQVYWHFNPQGPRGPRRLFLFPFYRISEISIHKALAGLDEQIGTIPIIQPISIHKALAGLDLLGSH